MGDSLSAHDSKFVSIAFKCMKSKPDIDYAKFAKMAGLKGVKSARDGFAAVYKRIEAASDDTAEDCASGADEPSPEKEKANPARKRKAPVEGTAKRGKKPKVKEEPLQESASEADGNATDNAADDAAPAEDI